MGSKRPSPSVTLVTVVVGCVLAAGGYMIGNTSDGGEVPARVPLQSVAPPAGADAIVVPSDVDLPSR